MYQPHTFISINDCNIVENCANGKCLIAAFFQGESGRRSTSKDIDSAIASAIDTMVNWSESIVQVKINFFSP